MRKFLVILIFISSPALALDYTARGRGARAQTTNPPAQTSDERGSIWEDVGPKERTASQPKTPIGQDTQRVKPDIMRYARHIHQMCSGNWKSSLCVKSLAYLSNDMTIDYAQKLENAGEQSYHQPLKEHCAAPVAAMNREIPAYAQKSAMTECVNAISDITEASGVKPDLDMYQLAVSGVMCLDKKSCPQIEKQLAAAVKQAQ